MKVGTRINKTVARTGCFQVGKHKGPSIKDVRTREGRGAGGQSKADTCGRRGRGVSGKKRTSSNSDFYQNFRSLNVLKDNI